MPGYPSPLKDYATTLRNKGGGEGETGGRFSRPCARSPSARPKREKKKKNPWGQDARTSPPCSPEREGEGGGKGKEFLDKGGKPSNWTWIRSRRRISAPGGREKKKKKKGTTIPRLAAVLQLLSFLARHGGGEGGKGRRGTERDLAKRHQVITGIFVPHRRQL